MFISPEISFKGFCRRSTDNPDGWGLAFYPDKSVQIFKEPITANDSHLAEFLKGYPKIRSRIIIGHVRLTSGSAVCHKNTHPFSRELNGKEFVFAHNGTISRLGELKLGRFKPIGDTDSEQIFCYILSSIEERKILEWNQEDFKWLNDLLKEINNYGDLNCILSDGEFLFCYHDIYGYKSLRYVKRESPYPKIKLSDEDYEIDLAEKKTAGEYGYIIASNPLTEEDWNYFKNGELIIFKNGHMIYPHRPDIPKFSTPQLSDLEKNILKIIRKSPHRIKLKIIIENINEPAIKVKEAMNSLLCNKYICQDSRDTVKSSDDNATFYTNPEKRSEIDKIINS